MTTEIAPRGENLPERQEFSAIERIESRETAAMAVAAREKAATEARYVMAERHPRDLEKFRVRLLAECRRHGFAAQAEYERPVGGGKIARGPSIRFIEGALRCYGNVYPEAMTVYDGPDLRIVRVTVTDLEANLAYSSEIQIPKRVERKGFKGQPPKGRTVISDRINSAGEKTYLVEATDDEIRTLQAALISKTMRVLAQRLLPGDIIEEAMAVARRTKVERDAADPDAAKRAVIDGFAEIGVGPDELEIYLEHPLGRIQPAELSDLRAVYTAIRSGETTWDEVMEAKNPVGSVEAAQEVAQKKLAAMAKKKVAPADTGKKAEPAAAPKIKFGGKKNAQD